MQLSFYILFFYILRFNSLFALLKNQSTKERERINQLLNNVSEGLRADFTSDENFRQFQLLKADNSSKNIDLVTKFVKAAVKDGTITEAEIDIFIGYIKRVTLESERYRYNIETILQEEALDDMKFCEEMEISHRKKEELEKQGLERLERAKEKAGQNSITSRMFSWFWPFVGDKNKESVVQEERAGVRESELLAEEMEKVTSSGMVSLIKKK